MLKILNPLDGLKVLGILLTIGLVLFVTTLPEKYRKEGDARTELRMLDELEASNKDYLAKLDKEYVLKKQEDELKNKEVLYAHDQEIALIKSNASKSIGLYFNKSRICSGELAKATEGSNTGSIHEASPSSELLPEPYGRNIKELMLEADMITTDYRGLQESIKGKSCLIVK